MFHRMLLDACVPLLTGALFSFVCVNGCVGDNNSILMHADKHSYRAIQRARDEKRKREVCLVFPLVHFFAHRSSTVNSHKKNLVV